MAQQFTYKSFKVFIVHSEERKSFIPSRVDVVFEQNTGKIFMGDGETPGGVFLASKAFLDEASVDDSALWGMIGGDIADQTDLQAVFTAINAAIAANAAAIAAVSQDFDTVGVLHVSTNDATATDTRGVLSDYSRATPFKTIQAAVDAAGANEIIIVHFGAYVEELTGKSDLHIHFEEDTTLTNSTDANDTFVITGASVTNFKITGSLELNTVTTTFRNAGFRFISSTVDIELESYDFNNDGYGIMYVSDSNVTMNVHKDVVGTSAGNAYGMMAIVDSDVKFTARELHRSGNMANSNNGMINLTGTLTQDRTVSIKCDCRITSSGNGDGGVFSAEFQALGQLVTGGFDLNAYYTGNTYQFTVLVSPFPTSAQTGNLNYFYTDVDMIEDGVDNNNATPVTGLAQRDFNIELRNVTLYSINTSFDVTAIAASRTFKAINCDFNSGQPHEGTQHGNDTEDHPIGIISDSWTGNTVELVDCRFKVGPSNTNGFAFENTLTAPFTGLTINKGYAYPPATATIDIDANLSNQDVSALNWPEFPNRFNVTNAVHVDRLHNNATDTRTGLSATDPLNPFATIQAAVVAAGTSGISLIVVHAGDYINELVNTTAASTEIHFMPGTFLRNTIAEASPLMTIDMANIVISGYLRLDAGNLSTATALTISADCEIQLASLSHAGSTELAIEVTSGVTNLELSNPVVSVGGFAKVTSGATLNIRNSNITTQGLFSESTNGAINIYTSAIRLITSVTAQIAKVSASLAANIIFYDCNLSSDAVQTSPPFDVTGGLIRLFNTVAILDGTGTCSLVGGGTFSTFSLFNSTLRTKGLKTITSTGGAFDMTNSIILNVAAAGTAVISMDGVNDKTVSCSQSTIQGTISTGCASVVWELAESAAINVLSLRNCSLFNGSVSPAAIVNLDVGNNRNVIISGCESTVPLLGDDLTNNITNSGNNSPLVPTNKWQWTDQNTLISPKLSLKSTGTQELTAGTPQLPTGYSLDIHSIKPYVAAVTGATDGFAEIGLGITGDTVALVLQYNASTLLLVNNGDYHVALVNDGDLVKSLKNEVFVADTGAGSVLDIRFLYKATLVKDD